jgi:hypothetical protein
MTKSNCSGARPADMDRMLRDARAQEMVSQNIWIEANEELRRLRRGLGRTVCSESWLHHCWFSGEVFPPPADTTPMIRCDCDHCRPVGRLWPAGYGVTVVRSGDSGDTKCTLSYECYLESLSDWDAAQLPSSPSGGALRIIREGRITVQFRRTRVGSRR